MKEEKSIPQFSDVKSENQKVFSTKDTHSTSMTAMVDATPQELTKRLRGFTGSALLIPMALSLEAKIVLEALFACFEKTGEVKEGKAKDVVWGFLQGQFQLENRVVQGIPAELSVKGIDELIEQGYLKLQANDGAFIRMSDLGAQDSWVRYTRKILDMVYEDPKIFTK